MHRIVPQEAFDPVRAVTLFRLLLAPSWLVVAAALLIAFELTTQVGLLRPPVSQILGHIVLFGVFVAPVATTVATALALWITASRQRGEAGAAAGAPRLWLPLAGSYACIAAAWGLLYTLLGG